MKFQLDFFSEPGKDVKTVTRGITAGGLICVSTDDLATL